MKQAPSAPEFDPQSEPPQYTAIDESSPILPQNIASTSYRPPANNQCHSQPPSIHAPICPPPIMCTPDVSCWPQTQTGVTGYDQFSEFPSFPGPVDILKSRNLSALSRQSAKIPKCIGYPTNKIKRVDNGVVSYDPELSESSDALLNYFICYGSEKPQLLVTITGNHIEKRLRNHHSHHHTSMNGHHNHNSFGNHGHGSIGHHHGHSSIGHHRDHHGHGNFGHHHGHGSNHHHYEDVLMEDFSVTFDLTAYVSDIFSQCVLKGVDLNSAVNDFILSDNKNKEISCVKTISGWNLNYINNKITEFIRSRCCLPSDRKLKISYTLRNINVTAKSDSRLLKMADNGCVRCLCLFTCLCVCFLPCYLVGRKKFSNSLVFDYQMNVCEDDFLNSITYQLHDTVVNMRKNQKFICTPISRC